MATNGPFVPSMIFKSRMTKQLSNVIEQKACSRSLASSMSLMRTSVISTAVLLAKLALVARAHGIDVTQDHCACNRPATRRACRA